VQAEKDAVRIELLEELFTEVLVLREVVLGTAGGELPPEDGKDAPGAARAIDSILDLLDQRLQMIADRWGA
jgi:hypothetical protein